MNLNVFEGSKNEDGTLAISCVQDLVSRWPELKAHPGNIGLELGWQDGST